MTPLKLNCSVFGQDRSQIFQVTLERTQSIADLKQEIKEKKKPAFDHVPADNLVLWKASVGVDSNKRNVESLTLLGEESLYSLVKELGDVFSPEREHLHYFL